MRWAWVCYRCTAQGTETIVAVAFEKLREHGCSGAEGRVYPVEDY